MHALSPLPWAHASSASEPSNLSHCRGAASRLFLCSIPGNHSRISTGHKDEGHLSFFFFFSFVILDGGPCPLGCWYYPRWLPFHHNPPVWVVGIPGTSSGLECTYSWFLSWTWMSWGQVYLSHNNSKIWIMETVCASGNLEAQSSLWSANVLRSPALPTALSAAQVTQAFFPRSLLASWRDIIWRH